MTHSFRIKNIFLGTILFISCISPFVFAQEENKSINAADVYLESHSLLSPRPQGFKKKARDVIINGWSNENEELRKLLEENKTAIDKFKYATQLKECRFEMDKSLIETFDTKFPEYFSSLPDLAWLIVMEGMQYEKENKWDLALEDYISVLRYSNHMEHQSNFVIYHMILGNVAQKIAYRPLVRYIKKKDLDAKECRYLLEQLVVLADSKREGFEDAIDAERKVVINTLKLSIEQNVTINKEKFMEALDRASETYFGYLKSAFKTNNPEELRLKIEELNPEIKKEIKPLSQLGDLLITALKAYSEGDEPSEAIAKHVEELLMANAIMGYSKNISSFYVKVAEFDLLINAIALKLYELENSKSVNDLYELVPKYISSLPRDPFNYSLSFRYLQKDNGWVLYSLGPDKKDDNADLIYDQFVDNTKTQGDIIIPSF